MKVIGGLGVCFRTTTEVNLRPLDPFGDDEPHLPPFNLSHQLMSERRFVPEFGEPRHLEVLTLAGDLVTDVRTLAPGQSFEVGPDVSWWRRLRFRDIPRRRRLIQVTREGAWVHMDGVCGTLVRDGRRQRLDVAGDVALLRPGDVVHLFDGDDTAHHIRFAAPPRRTPTPTRRITERLRAVCWPAWGASLAIHVVGLLVAGLLFEPWPTLVHRPVERTVVYQYQPPFTGHRDPTQRRLERGVQLPFHVPTEIPRASLAAGHLHRDEIQRVINRNIGQVQRCIERALLETPGLSGKIAVEWTITRSGRVRAATVTHDSLGSPSASACLLQEIRRWRFPRPEGGEVIVNYPFIIHSIGF